MNATLVTDAPLAHLSWGDSGPLLVLLHGVGGGRQIWGDAMSGTGRALAEAGYWVVAPDFPGYGLSASISPFDLQGLAGRVQVLIEFKQAGAAIVLGHSMGGMVAQELYARSPHCVAALILCSTSSAFGRADGQWQRDFLSQRFAPLDAGLGMAGLAAQLVPAMCAPGADPVRVALAQALMAGVPEATYRQALTALVAFDRRADLARIRVPTLLLTGDADRAAPPEVARRMAERIAGSECAILEQSGHLANVEQPRRFHDAVLAFLQRHAETKGG